MKIRTHKIAECVIVCRGCSHPFDLNEKYYDFVNHGKFHENCIPSYLKTKVTEGSS